jgi:hypothetical protein
MIEEGTDRTIEKRECVRRMPVLVKLASQMGADYES